MYGSYQNMVETLANTIAPKTPTIPTCFPKIVPATMPIPVDHFVE